MKKILFLGLLVTTGIIATAQSYNYDNSRKVRLGFKFDPVFSNVLNSNGKGIDKNGSRMGFSYGLMADFQFSDARGAIATGLEITHANTRLKVTDAEKGLAALRGSTDQRYDIRLQYLQIPVSVKLKTDPVNNLAWWGQFGTYLAVKLSARADYENGIISDEKVNISNSVTPLNSGLLLGGGAEYTISNNTTIFAGIGLEKGFVDVTRNKRWNDGSNVNLNRWALRLGVFF